MAELQEHQGQFALFLILSGIYTYQDDFFWRCIRWVWGDGLVHRICFLARLPGITEPAIEKTRACCTATCCLHGEHHLADALPKAIYSPGTPRVHLKISAVQTGVEPCCMKEAVSSAFVCTCHLRVPLLAFHRYGVSWGPLALLDMLTLFFWLANIPVTFLTKRQNTLIVPRMTWLGLEAAFAASCIYLLAANVSTFGTLLRGLGS